MSDVPLTPSEIDLILFALRFYLDERCGLGGQGDDARALAAKLELLTTRLEDLRDDEPAEHFSFRCDGGVRPT